MRDPDQVRAARSIPSPFSALTELRFKPTHNCSQTASTAALAIKQMVREKKQLRYGPPARPLNVPDENSFVSTLHKAVLTRQSPHHRTAQHCTCIRTSLTPSTSSYQIPKRTSAPMLWFPLRVQFANWCFKKVCECMSSGKKRRFACGGGV